ncbi:NAD(P)H-dependent flavin oxidoreductase [Microbispora sp. ATCC PTA-5024]|uniref:NAD(P)H-dependent flavin oxidoreductase n=1 Tax=Microbispora sp. ATCC PTA-5024 TaxID=316330 RepID=UPI0003DBF430|nr:nitronate monooxygenase [Microbispora sp. ATCC PTA-5024]ETK37057.1 2-nitropropane dioxygenase [Microbispora sp. ATCC PTA-5024]
MIDQVFRTPLTRLAGVRHPVVQTGMGWVAGPRLVSAVAEAGGLGILASATLSLDGLAAAVAEVRRRTSAPFGVNLRADAADADARAGLLIREGVKVASFALAPRRDLIDRLKEAGVVVIPTVGARRHAEKVAAWGADAVMVQGGEGGGHTGPLATTLLLPQVVDAVGVPVIAAGGFFDGRGLAAALSYGAAGVAMGTRFLLTADSPVPDAVKAVYLDASETVVTRRVDGTPHRVLRTPLVDALERSGRLAGLARALRNAHRFRGVSGMSWPALVRDGRAMRRARRLGWAEVLMAANTPMLLRSAMVDGRPDLGVMAAGQVVALLGDLPTCEELIDRVVGDAAAVLRRLSARLDGDGAHSAD